MNLQMPFRGSDEGARREPKRFKGAAADLASKNKEAEDLDLEPGSLEFERSMAERAKRAARLNGSMILDR